MATGPPTVYDSIGVRNLIACGAVPWGSYWRRTWPLSLTIFINEFHEEKYKSYYQSFLSFDSRRRLNPAAASDPQMRAVNMKQTGNFQWGEQEFDSMEN
jgi:hypothetical protein